VRGPRPTPCNFPEDFLQEARATVRRRTAAVRDVPRARLVLFLHAHPDLSPDDAARCVGLSARQVQRWRQRWVAGDFSIEDEKGRGCKPTFSPAGSRPRESDGL
jgi:Homeodomain-like domain